MSRTTTRLLLLGAPRIEVDGAPVEVDTRKATALLAYLAVTGHRHTRDALAGLLWPEYAGRRARAALRRTLSSLSSAREGGWLEVGRESIGLVREKTWVDVDRFRELLAECRTGHGHRAGEVCADCLEPLEEAVALYRDHFLAGFALRDSAAFDDWQFFESEELRRELAGALEGLSRVLAGRAEWERAISHSRRWLSLDHLHEPAHRWLMLVYAWAGQRTAALRQYRECVRVLGAELGVSPLEETTRLYESIREDNVPQPPTVSEASPLVASRAGGGDQTAGAEPREGAPLRGTYREPLVGRRSEWEALLRAYAAASERGGRLVVVEGEAGVGKTRLAEALVERASREGATALAARCYAGESSLAYGPFVECLSAAARREDLAVRLAELPEHLLVEVSRLVPALADLPPGLPPPPPLEDPGARSRFLEGICEALVAVCNGPPPGVVFIDDVHWADSSSLDLLAYLMRRSRMGQKPCILLTWRNEDVGAVDRLRGLLKEAQRAHVATLIPLARLDRAAVDELVGAVVGEAAEALADRLYYETEGLPLFLAEYLAAIAAGDLDAEEEEWSLPGGVRDLLAGRLQTVGESARQLLGAAATIGRSFDFDTVREASGRGEEETISALEELVRAGLIEELGEDREGSPTYDFSHEKLRALVYEETSLARRRLLHRRIAETLARRAHRRREVGPAAAQIARHYQLAGRDAEAGRYFETAGEHARSLYANVEALSHLRAALALGHPDVSGLHEAIGDLHTLLGEYGEALSSYEAAGAFGDGAHLAGIEHKLGEVYARLGERDLAEKHLEAALSAPGGPASANERARTYAGLSLVAHHRGQPDLALERAHRALEEAAGDERALAQAHNVLGVLATGRGDLGEARHHLERSLGLAEALDDPVARVAALNNLALALGSGGELEGALERARTALDLCISLGDRHREAALHNNLADLLHAAGRREESMSHLKRAVEIFAEIGDGGELRPEIWKLVEW